MVLANVTMTADVTVGEHVVLMPQVVLTHDDVVADYATLCAGVVLGGTVHIGAGAYLGMNSSVRQGIRVGRDATLGHGVGAAAGPAGRADLDRYSRASDDGAIRRRPWLWCDDINGPRWAIPILKGMTRDESPVG